MVEPQSRTRAETSEILQSLFEIEESVRWSKAQSPASRWRKASVVEERAPLLDSLSGKPEFHPPPLLPVTVTSVFSKHLNPPKELHLDVHDYRSLCDALRREFLLTQDFELSYYDEGIKQLIPVHDTLSLPPYPNLVIRSLMKPLHLIAETLRSSIACHKHRYLRTVHSNCFFGDELVDSILQLDTCDCTSRSAALQLAELLLRSGFIECIETKEFQDNPVSFRFADTKPRQEGTPPEANTLLPVMYTWTEYDPVPKECRLPTPSNGIKRAVVMIAAGTGHFLALSELGTVYSWGSGKRGQLGHPLVTNSTEPLEICLPGECQAVYAGYFQSGVKTGDNKVFLWGWQSHLANHRSIPQKQQLPRIVEQDNCQILDLQFGIAHAVLLLEHSERGVQTRKLYSVGSNEKGQLGYACESREEFYLVQALEGFSIHQVSCGAQFNLVLTKTHQILTWGDNTNYCLGTQNKSDFFHSPELVQLPRSQSGLLFTRISCGPDFSCALTNKGSAFLWGNPSSSLGPFTKPRRANCLEDITQIRCGGDFIIFLRETDGPTIEMTQRNANTESGGQVLVQVSLPVSQVFYLCAGHTSSLLLAIDEPKKVITSAAVGNFLLHTGSFRRKVSFFVIADECGSYQRQARDHHSENLKSVPWPNVSRSLERSKSMNRRPVRVPSCDANADVLGVSVDKYRAFSSYPNIQAFEYVKDEFVITNEGGRPASFRVSCPRHEHFQIVADPIFGSLLSGQYCRVKLSLVALRSNNLTNVIHVEVSNAQGSIYNLFLGVQVTSRVVLQVPEYPFQQLQGGTLLGSGASGSVHLLQLNGRKVAVKTFFALEMSAEEVESFRNEVSVTSNLSHPNLIDCFGACIEYPNLALILEYLPLKDLRSLIDQSVDAPEKLSLPMIARIGLDVAEAMQYLHSKRVVHRDLKPDNILMNNLNPASPLPCAKVADFGTCFNVLQSPSDASGNIGTIRYMPLEVLEPPSALNPKEVGDPSKVDVYSFGLILFEMLSKEVPFVNCNFSSQIIAALEADEPLPFNPLWKVPRELIQLIRLCTHKDAERRPFFEQIVQELVLICTWYPVLTDHVISKRNQLNMQMLPTTGEDMALFQVDNLTKRQRVLESKRSVLLDQMAHLQVSLDEFNSELEELNDQITTLTPVALRIGPSVHQ